MNRAYLFTMMAGWRERLLAAVDADERSDRRISLDAGLGENFVNELRNTDKDPGTKRVLALAKELNVSLNYLFLAREDITAEDEEFLHLLDQGDPAARAGLLQMLRANRRASE